ncbi:dienelactone hydrolase family protein [Kribbella sp. NPDC056951]|uniref:dienelactone hydrolase family protein n=1 Tax=Kribbella sp. NPDC056951 TaxID=3345978 RepID=UPI003636DEEE
MFETDLRLTDGRALHVYDSAPCDDGRLAVVTLGVPTDDLYEAGEWLGIRWISCDLASTTAADLAAVVDAACVEGFALMGHAEGGALALRTAALLGDRVEAVVTFASTLPAEFVLTAVDGPVLLCHGLNDTVVPPANSRWLATRLALPTLDLHPHLDHTTILTQSEPALEWIRDHTG